MVIFHLRPTSGVNNSHDTLKAVAQPHLILLTHYTTVK